MSILRPKDGDYIVRGLYLLIGWTLFGWVPFAVAGAFLAGAGGATITAIIGISISPILYKGYLKLDPKVYPQKTKKKSSATLFSNKQIREWERVFAWLPVQTIDNGRVWLRYYWRRQIYSPATVDGTFEETFYYQNVIKIAWYTW